MKKQGFSLVETLVVVVIIGILTAVALPQYQRAVAKSRVGKVMSDLQTLTEAENVFYATYTRHTADLDELDAQVSPDTKYYNYRCMMNGYSSCLAIPKQEGFPVIEFNLANRGHYSGRKWCQVVDAGSMSATGKARALKICVLFTSAKDPDIPAYYLL